jgi:hypothetical protein
MEGKGMFWPSIPKQKNPMHGVLCRDDGGAQGARTW